jgi:hypothetical protein
MILAASGIAGLIVTLLMRARFLSSRAIDAPPRGAATGAGPTREEHAEPIIGG